MTSEFPPTIDQKVDDKQTGNLSVAPTQARVRDWDRSYLSPDLSTELSSLVGDAVIVEPRAPNFRSIDDEEVSLLQKYEGFVSEISDDEFRARFSQHEGDYPVLEAEFLNEELTESDRKILAVGMPLVWSIIRERRKGGIRRSSILYIRRIAPPDQERIDSASRSLNEWVDGCTE